MVLSPAEEIHSALPDLYPRLWRFCLTLTGCPDAAADLAQATAARAMEKSALYQVGTRLDSWLFTMARRLWLNEARARAVRQGNGITPLEEVELPSQGPDAEMNRSVSEVFEEVRKLPREQRVAVLLVYVENHTCAEAAEITGVPLGTVLSRLATARRRIKAALAPIERAAE